MRKNKRFVLALLCAVCAAALCAAFTACGDKTKAEPQLHVTSDVAEAPYAISMGDYELQSVKFNGETLSQDLYKSKYGHLIFLVDSYGYFGSGELEFVLVFDGGEEKTLVVTQTDTQEPKYVLPDVPENYVFSAENFVFPAAEKLNPYQNYEISYHATMNESELPCEVTENGVKVTADKEGEVLLEVQLVKDGVAETAAEYPLRVVSEENYRAIFDLGLSEQFVSRWQKQSLVNEVEYFGDIEDDYGDNRSAVKFINNEYVGRGDERTFGLPIEYLNAARENGFNTLHFSYLVPNDPDNFFETNTVYIALWNSERQVMNWDKVLYGAPTVGKWTDISIDLSELEGYEDLSVSFMCESKSWYVSDVYFSYEAPSDDPLFNAFGTLGSGNEIEMVGAAEDNNGVKYEAYHLINTTAQQEGDNRTFYISRDYLDAANDTISFKYYIPEDSAYNGNYTLYFGSTDRSAFLWDKPLYDGVVLGEWTSVSFPLENGYDFAILLTGWECYIADVQASRDSEDIRVIYDLNGGTSDEPLSVDIVEGQPVPQLITAERNGYEFYGWFDGKEKITDLSQVKKSTTLTARWTVDLPLSDLGYKDFDGGRQSTYNEDGTFQFDSWGWCRIVFENVSLDGLFSARVTTSTTLSQIVQIGPTLDGGVSMAPGCTAPALTTTAETPMTFDVDCSQGGNLAYFVHNGDGVSSPCVITEIILVY